MSYRYMSSSSSNGSGYFQMKCRNAKHVNFPLSKKKTVGVLCGKNVYIS